MDTAEDNMMPVEMVEKIAELEFSQNQLRVQNAEMRHWLDAADDEMESLRSDNASLRKHVKVLENIISDAQQVEAEPCRSRLTDDLDAKICNERRIQELERDCTILKEQKKKLTEELKSIQQESVQDKTSLNKFSLVLRNLENEIGEAQLWLQDKDEVIHQKNMQLKHVEETLEECSGIIEDLRFSNQELRKQLEERQEEASFATLNDVMAEKEGLFSPPLSFAEEIKLLASSATVTDSVETEAEEVLETPRLTVDLQTKRCESVLETAVKIAKIMMLSVFVLAVLAFVASQSFFVINAMWRGAHVMIQPHCTVHYGALPPI